MKRLQGLGQKDFYLPERMFNVRVYFLALLVIFCTWGQVKGGSFFFVFLAQIWSHTVLVSTIVIMWKALRGKGPEITGRTSVTQGFWWSYTFLIKFLLVN